jgi:hypothetical protein
VIVVPARGLVVVSRVVVVSCVIVVSARGLVPVAIPVSADSSVTGVGVSCATILVAATSSVSVPAASSILVAATTMSTIVKVSIVVPNRGLVVVEVTLLVMFCLIGQND